MYRLTLQIYREKLPIINYDVKELASSPIPPLSLGKKILNNFTIKYYHPILLKYLFDLYANKSLITQFLEGSTPISDPNSEEVVAGFLTEE